MENILNAALAMLLPHLLAVGITLVLSVATLVMYKFKGEIKYAQIALDIVRKFLGNSLGDKTDMVLSIWYDALTAIADNKFSEDNLAIDFTNYIKTTLSSKGVVLTALETSIIEEAALFTIKMLKVKKASTVKALKVMVSEASVRVNSVSR